VRVCEPCKKLEEAARFEARQGHKNRASKGVSRITTTSESEILEHIPSTGKKPQRLADSDSIGDDCLDHPRVSDDASSSKYQERDDTAHDRKHDIFQSSFRDSPIHANDEKDSSTPEELRQQAQEEKKKYHILKKEGKGEEALQAFKRGKELERRSEALELSFRKSRRRAVSAALASRERRQEDLGDSVRKTPETLKDGDRLEPSVLGKNQKSLRQTKDEKDDISIALKELGWSDADLQDADRKRSKMNLEGELSTLLGESQKVKSTGNESVVGAGQMQVLAHKRRALALKREGKLVEAKEELKKAKILEKQLEEQEMIDEGDESDDELAALIRGLDNESKVEAHSLGGLGMKFADDSVFDLSQLATMGDEYDDNMGVDVTDDDINDPEFTAALKSIGWTDETSKEPLSVDGAGVNIEYGSRSSIQPPIDATSRTYHDRASLQQDVLSLKREALALKRAGNVTEAMEQLRRAKVLEKELQDIQSQHQEHGVEASNPVDTKKPRSGNMDKKLQLPGQDVKFMRLDDKDDELIEVTDEDMGDPELAKALKNLGWQENDQLKVLTNNSEDENFHHAESAKNVSMVIPLNSKTKSELQKELLGLKRKALALRREGRIDEADAELSKGKLLEQQLEEIEKSTKTPNACSNVLQEVFKENHKGRGSDSGALPVKVEEDPERVVARDMRKLRDIQLQHQVHGIEEAFNPADNKKLRSGHMGKNLQLQGQDARFMRSDDKDDELTEVTEEDMEDPELANVLKDLGWQEDDQPRVLTNNSGNENFLPAQTAKNVSVATPLSSKTKTKAELQKELLGLKRKALALRREGRIDEADAEISKGNLLEQQLQEIESKRDSTIDRSHDKEDKFLEINAKGESKKNLSVHEHGEMRLGVDLGPLILQGKDQEDALTKATNPLDVERQPTKSIDLLTGENLKPLFLEPGEKLLKFSGSESVSDSPASASDISVRGNVAKAQVKVIGASGASPEQNVQYDKFAQRTQAALPYAGDILIGTSAVKCDGEAISVPASPIGSPLQSLQQEILSHKRKALALKREGKLAEAREQLRLAKLLEREEGLQQNVVGNDGHVLSSSTVPDVVSISQQTLRAQTANTQTQKGPMPTVQSYQTTSKIQSDLASDSILISSVGSKDNTFSKKQQIHKQAQGRDRMKLQQEALAHKRRALALRREGKLEESEAEFELAKSLEIQMDELAGNSQTHTSIDGIGNDDSDAVDDIFDPQLLSALKGIGWRENDIFSQMPTKGVHAKNKELVSTSSHVHGNLGNDTAQANADKTEGSKDERSRLEENIRAEKLKALDLKRAGKQGEALDALRRAKQLEKKLQSLAT